MTDAIHIKRAILLELVVSSDLVNHTLVNEDMIVIVLCICEIIKFKYKVILEKSRTGPFKHTVCLPP